MIDSCRVEIKVDLCTKEGVDLRRLTSLEEQLTIPTCGLQCRIGDVNDWTPLNRRRTVPQGTDDWAKIRFLVGAVESLSSALQRSGKNIPYSAPGRQVAKNDLLLLEASEIAVRH